MCKHPEGFYRGPAMIFVCFVELLVFFCSCYAISKHLSENSGKFGDMFQFHFCHVMFCLFFGIYHFGTLTYSGMCYCDPYNITYLVYVVFYGLMLETFLRYWKRVTTKLNEKRELYKIRIFFYTFIMFFFVFFYSLMIFRKKCHVLDGLRLFQALLVLIVTVDLFILSVQAWKRAKELQIEALSLNNQNLENENHNTMFTSTPAMRESYLFFSIPMSMLIGFCLELTGNVDAGSIAQLFFWLIPSIVTLKITWKRDYLSFFDESKSNKKHLSKHGAQEIEWQINELRRQENSSDYKRKQTLTNSRSMSVNNIIDNSIKNFRSYFTQSTESYSVKLLSLLTQTGPLTSRIVIRGDVKSFDKHGSSSSLSGPSRRLTKNLSPQNNSKSNLLSSGSSLNDGNSMRDGGSGYSSFNNSGNNQSSSNLTSAKPWYLIIEEDLRPSREHGTLVSNIVTGIFLKPLESSYAAHQSRVETLLKISKPKQRLTMGLGDLEKMRQFQELKNKLSNLTSDFDAFLKNVRHLALPLMEESSDQCSFKATQNKKSKDLALYTTNLNTHLSVLTKQYIDVQSTTSLSSSTSSSSSSSTSSSSSSSTSNSISSAAVSSPIQTLHKKYQQSNQSDTKLNNNAILSDADLSSEVDSSMLISSVTFGAPCAHSLGFKYGGLRKLFHKLEVESHKQQTNPEATLNFLNLRFQAKAREAIVLSQGIGALVITAIDLLSRSLITRDMKNMKQFQEIGIFVHSILMLSTHGHEECMIDDFAGAYEKLKIKLKFISPKKHFERKTVGFNFDHLTGNGDDDEEGDGEGGISMCSLTSSMKDSTVMRRLDTDIVEPEERINQGTEAQELFKVTKVSSTPSVSSKHQSAAAAGGGGSLGSSHQMSSSVFGDSMENSTAGHVTVTLQVNSTEDFKWLTDILGTDLEMDILPCLFNLGVNEMQSIANKTGSTQIQTDVNRKGLSDLNAYYEKFLLFNQSYSLEDTPPPPPPSLVTSISLSNIENVQHVDHSDDENEENEDNIKKLLLLLETQIEEEAVNKNKNVDLLLTSCEIARLLNAARTTSCKSAKDRTSVFHTLEIAKIAEKKGWLHKSRESDLLEELRGMHGVRLRNCESNIGRAKYSFNQLQLQALPSELRPPSSTCSGGKS